MAKQRLDSRLLDKLTRRLAKPTKYVREQVSKRAAKRSISSEAALILWAKELGIGTAACLNRQPPHVRDEVRQSLPTDGPARTRPPGTRAAGKTAKRARSRPVFEELLQDDQLRERCGDLLKAKKHFDRAIREATTVLDDRLKKLSGIANMNPLDLIGKVLNPDPQKAVIVVSAKRDEQDGLFSLCKGLTLLFRNPTHHALNDKLKREYAIKFCGIVDVVLGLVANGKVYPERST